MNPYVLWNHSAGSYCHLDLALYVVCKAHFDRCIRVRVRGARKWTSSPSITTAWIGRKVPRVENFASHLIWILCHVPGSPCWLDGNLLFSDITVSNFKLNDQLRKAQVLFLNLTLQDDDTAELPHDGGMVTPEVHAQSSNRAKVSV